MQGGVQGRLMVCLGGFVGWAEVGAARAVSAAGLMAVCGPADWQHRRQGWSAWDQIVAGAATPAKCPCAPWACCDAKELDKLDPTPGRTLPVIPGSAFGE